MLAAALAGRGVVMFPTWLFNPETLQGGHMVTLLDDWEFSPQSERVHLQLLSPENKLRSRKVREVSAFLTDAIGSPPYWDRAVP